MVGAGCWAAKVIAASSTLSYPSCCGLCSACQELSPWNYLGIPCLQAEQVGGHVVPFMATVVEPPGGDFCILPDRASQSGTDSRSDTLDSTPSPAQKKLHPKDTDHTGTLKALTSPAG